MEDSDYVFPLISVPPLMPTLRPIYSQGGMRPSSYLPIKRLISGGRTGCRRVLHLSLEPFMGSPSHLCLAEDPMKCIVHIYVDMDTFNLNKRWTPAGGIQGGGASGLSGPTPAGLQLRREWMGPRFVWSSLWLGGGCTRRLVRMSFCLFDNPFMPLTLHLVCVLLGIKGSAE